MTKAQFGTPDYYRERLAKIETELKESLDDGERGNLAYAYAYGRLFGSMKSCIAHLESATASQACRQGCNYIPGHSGPCIERDLDAEIDAGRWGIDYVTDPSKWGCANAIDPSKWDEGLRGPDFVKKPDEEFVNVNHE